MPWDIKTHIDSNTMILGDFSTSVSLIAMSPWPKHKEINKLYKWWQHISDGPDRPLQSIPYCNSTIFSAAHGNFIIF
jgi:hypothetical protein